MVNWRTIEGYEGCYEVSDTGLVRSLDRWVTTKNNIKFLRGRLLKQKKSKYGYKEVVLSKNAERKHCRVHRLVATAFLVNNDPAKKEVNHKNCIKDDNNVNNLEWVSAEENMQHASIAGRLTKVSLKGTDSLCYKGDIHVYDLEGRLVIVLTGAADMISKGFNTSHVSQCLKHPNRTHKGYKFRRYNKELPE